MVIEKLENGNVLFLRNAVVINTFLPSCEILEGEKANIVQISNTGNFKLYGFNYKNVTSLTTPAGSISIPDTRAGFIKVLAEHFFYIKNEETAIIIEDLDLILEGVEEIIDGQEVNNFYYFQFPLTLDFDAIPTINGDFNFEFFDGNNQSNFGTNVLNGQTLSGIAQLCDLLNSVQNIFTFYELTDLTQIPNYSEGLTTIGIKANDSVPTAYIQNTLEIYTDQGNINRIMLESFETPISAAQKLNLQVLQFNDNFLEYSSEANFTTPVFALDTKATTANNLYLLAALRATRNITIIIKEVQGKTLTANNSNLFVVVNPSFATDPPLFNVPLPYSTLDYGEITAGDPTPQVISEYEAPLGNFQISGNSTAKYRLNKKITLAFGDIVALGISSPTASLEANGYIAWLEQPLKEPL